MDIELSISYFMFVLAVTLTTILAIGVGGMLRKRARPKRTFKAKVLGFIVFIIGILLFGWLMERLQGWLHTYLLQNYATSISGILFALVGVWVLYILVIR